MLKSHIVDLSQLYFYNGLVRRLTAWPLLSPPPISLEFK